MRKGLREKVREIWRGMPKIAAFLTCISISIAAIVYIFEIDDRRQATILQAWAIVTDLEGKRVGGGRIEALRQLKEGGQRLAGIVLDGVILSGLDLSKTDLSYSSLQSVVLTDVSFSGSDLRHSLLNGGKFHGSCDFSGAVLERVVFREVLVNDCLFDKAKIHCAEGDSRTSFNGASMKEAKISNSSFADAIFDNVNLSGSDLVEVDFQGASFQRANVSDTIWIGVEAPGSIMRLQGKDARFLAGSNFRGARFDQSSLYGARFKGVDLQGASFFGAELLQGVVFQDCNLEGANFSSATFEGARFEGCNLKDIQLFGSDIKGIEAVKNCTNVPPSLGIIQ